MSRRANAAQRCPACRMHMSLCVCALVPSPPIATRTRVVLLIHRAEDRKPTNTGRLATACLANSEVIVRGRADSPTPPFVANAAPAYRPVLLFPHPDSIPLARFVETERDPRPVLLVVPDGNWRQASRVKNRVPGLRDIPRVTLPPGQPSVYRLRVEAHTGGLATAEAIARSLAILEGPDVAAAVLRPFHAMVERTLWSRGDLRDHEVEAGIPPGVLRHDPTSGARSRSAEGGRAVRRDRRP